MARTPTLDKQHTRAQTRASVALVGFTEAADELTAAADQLDAVAATSRLLAADHTDRARMAKIDADLNRARALRIRDLLK